LQRLSRATGKTRSQLIRQAIDQMQPKADFAAVLAGLSASAGAWKRRQSGERLVERMRRGRLARLHG
jgi:predicted transcriptional regulator